MLSTFYQRYQFTLQISRTALSLIPSRADIRIPLDRSRLQRKGDGEKRKVYSYAVRNAIHDDPPIFLKEGKYSDSLYKAGKYFLHRIGTLPRSTKPATSVWKSSFPIWQGRKM